MILKLTFVIMLNYKVVSMDTSEHGNVHVLNMHATGAKEIYFFHCMYSH